MDFLLTNTTAPIITRKANTLIRIVKIPIKNLLRRKEVLGVKQYYVSFTVIPDWTSSLKEGENLSYENGILAYGFSLDLEMIKHSSLEICTMVLVQNIIEGLSKSMNSLFFDDSTNIRISSLESDLKELARLEEWISD